MPLIDVYFRMVPPGRKPGGVVTIVTFVVSAFWHGFYPGYYFFFVLMALQKELGTGDASIYTTIFSKKENRQSFILSFLMHKILM